MGPQHNNHQLIQRQYQIVYYYYVQIEVQRVLSFHYSD
jgi:hypothetical protein